MKKKRQLGRKLLSFLLTLAMVVGLMPGMGLTAYADSEATTLGEDTLYVAGVDITKDSDGIIDSNVTGVTGGTATLTYEKGIPVLTLSNFNYSGTGETTSDKIEYGPEYAGIYYLGTETLVIRLSGTNEIGISNNSIDGANSAYGIYSESYEGKIVIESEDNGSVSITSTNANRYASNRTPMVVCGTLEMKSGTIITNSNTVDPYDSGIARGIDIGTLNFYGGAIQSTGSSKITNRTFDGIAFCIEWLGVQQGITPEVKVDNGETESTNTETLGAILGSTFKVTKESNTYHYASISAPDYREPVSYIDKDGDEATCSSYNIVTSNTTEWSSGWYVVNKDTTISRKIESKSDGGTVNIASGADVNLILCDGVKLTITDTNMDSTRSHPGIKLPENSTLNIYGQGATNPGELDVSYGGDGKSRQEYQIYGEGTEPGGAVVVNGGKLTFNGGSEIIRVTGFTVYDGIVNVIGGSYCAIRSTNVFVYGGEVTAIASVTADPCISGSVTVNGGKLIAQGGGGTYGNGIGGTITLGTGMYLYGGEDEASAVQMDTIAKAKYMRIDNTLPYKELDITGDKTPVTIQRGDSALSGAPVVGDVLTVVCPATDLVYEWFIDGISKGTASANNTSYTVTSADFGKTIKVKVYQTKNYSEGTDYAVDKRPSKDSASTAVVVKKTPDTLSVDDARTQAGISYMDETARPSMGYEISIDGTNKVNSPASLTTVLDSDTPKIFIRTAETNDTAAGTWVEVTLTSRPATPSNLSAVSATTATSTDGKINGTTSSMEYSADGGTTWTNVTDDPTLVKSGGYLVRTKATDSTPASKTAEVVVGSREIILSDEQKPTAKKGLVYTGSEQELVNVPAKALPEGATEIRYALGNATEAIGPYTTSIPSKTEAGTYYVWYKVVGDSTHTDTEPVSITVTIANRPSTPYVPYVPSNPAPAPATEAYTVPVSNENTVDISVNISEGNAVVQEITQADLDKITDDTSGSGSDGDKKTDDTKISVDVSGAKSEVTSVELSSTSIETLAKTVEANEKVDSVEIKMTNATVELDSAAVSAISEQKEGNTIKLVVENKEQAKLNETQKESLKSFTSVKPFQAYFESGGKEIHDFKGGKATVSIKFSPEAGRDAKYYHVYYVPLSGLIERYVTRYLNGWFSYTTSHFSDYAIVYDATMENETGKEDVTPSPSPDVIPTASPAPSASASPSPAPSGEKTGPVTAQEQAQAALDINAGLKVIHNGTSASVQWSKVDGAKYYKVYAAYCGSKYKMIKTVDAAAKCKVTIKKLNGKKLSTTKNIKVYVAAYRTVETKNGETVTKKDVRIAKTIAGHVVGKKNKKYSNAKKIKLSKTSYTLKKGKKAKIKAKTVLQYPKRKQLGDAHAKEFRYASSDKSIATVSKSGKITAKKKGSCVIYVYARNGLAKKVKVTVK